VEIAFATGLDRKSGVMRVLNLLGQSLEEKLRRSRKILIKPNFVSVWSPGCATHPDAVEAILEYIYSKFTPRKIILGEGSAMGDFKTGLENYGYMDIIDKYDVELVDLNEDDHVDLKIYDSSLSKSLKIPVAKTVVDSDFRISICRPKTHDTVIVTLSIKNIVMGAVQKPFKSKVHQGYAAINLSIAELAETLMPHLSVIDGVEGMEGDGPVSGEIVKWGVFLAGLNALEVDVLTTWLMGFNPREIGYLYVLANKGYGTLEVPKLLSEVIGEKPEKYRRKFKPHRSYIYQLSWRDSLEKTGY